MAFVSLSMLRCADLKLRRMSSSGTLRSGASRMSWLSGTSFVGFPILRSQPLPCAVCLVSSRSPVGCSPGVRTAALASYWLTPSSGNSHDSHGADLQLLTAPALGWQAAMANAVEELSADEIALYDRQLRLWGIEAQNRMRKAKVLLITIKALGNEVAKNLVLAGIGSLTIVDSGKVTETDVSSQFFVTKEDIGKNVCICFETADVGSSALKHL